MNICIWPRNDKTFGSAIMKEGDP